MTDQAPPHPARRRAATCAPLAAPLMAACMGMVPCAACSGEAFRFATELTANGAAGAGGTLASGPTHVATAPALADAGPLSSPADTGTSAPPTPGPCGFPRVENAALANEEVCLGPAEFTMGSSEPNLGGNYADHTPPHTVRLSAYFIDAYEVTVVRYRQCVQAGSCVLPKTGVDEGCTYSPSAGPLDRYPVTCVSWQAARDFCAWDSDRRLPTEAEWEFAARGTQGTLYPWGNSFDCERAVVSASWQCPEYSGSTPLPVGTTPRGASPQGVNDLAGNAWEWVFDRAASYYGAASQPQQDPTGPESGSTRIQRGGDWLTLANDAVSYARRGEPPAATAAFSFRCARGAP